MAPFDLFDLERQLEPIFRADSYRSRTPGTSAKRMIKTRLAEVPPVKYIRRDD